MDNTSLRRFNREWNFRHRRGATYVDLLVVGVIVILALLVLIPSIVRSRTSARRHTTFQRMNQNQMALATYHELFLSYPYVSFPPAPKASGEKKPPLTVQVPRRFLETLDPSFETSNARHWLRLFQDMAKEDADRLDITQWDLDAPVIVQAE